jgi:phage tail-like protein
MPGFNIGGQGAGNVPPANAETRRKHRWFFETMGDALKQNVLIVLSKAQRPSFKFSEAAMHHDQEVAWFAGKQEWDPIELEWYDTEQDPEASGAIWDWLNKVNQINQVSVAPPKEYKKQASLKMAKGDGSPSETWKIYNCWPREINWNELDYSSSDIATITVSMRYDRAEREGAGE